MTKNYKDFNLKKNMVHRPPMLLVDEILEETETCGKTLFTIKKDCIFLDKNGNLSRASLIEIAAQSLAAVDIFQKKQKNIKHTNGFLAYVRDFVFFEDAKAGDELICYMEKTDEFGQLHIAKVEITDRSGQKVFAKGEIRIYELPQ